MPWLSNMHLISTHGLGHFAARSIVSWKRSYCGAYRFRSSLPRLKDDQRYQSTTVQSLLDSKTDKSFEYRFYSVWDKKIKDPSTPLHAAAIDDVNVFARFLQDNPQHVHMTEDKFKATALHLAVLNSSKKVFDLIMSNHSFCDTLINLPDIHGMTPLHISVKSTNMHYYQQLIEKGADPNIKDDDGSNVLHVAAQNGVLDIVNDILANKRVSLEEQGQNGGTALHFAAFHGKLAVVELLVGAGAKVDALSSDDSTPLHLAAYGRKKNISIFLIDQGANVNARNKKGWTPLHAAASGDPTGIFESTIIEYLIQHGADIHALDNSGQLPRDLVETKTLKFLLSESAPDWHTQVWHKFKTNFRNFSNKDKS